MRVLFVLDSLAPGGTEQSTVVLAGRLRTLDVRPTIVTMRAAAHDLTPQAEAAGVPVIRLAPGSFLRQARELRRLIRSERPDLVHTALFDGDQLGRIAAWGTGVPVVSSFVNTPYDPRRRADPNVTGWKVGLVRAIDAVTGHLMVTRFHSVSDGVAEANARALRIPMKRVIVGERGRDGLGTCSDERRRATRESLWVATDAPVVLNLGRQDHQKGQTVLIEAAEQIATTHPELVVLIAGKEGSASAEIDDLLASRPAAARHVRLLGHRQDVADLLCAADVLAISSHFEGTAGVAVEAMALGTPIVSTDLVGVRGILEHDGNAVLVDVGDPDALAGGITRILDDRQLAARLAARGREDFDGRFTLDRAARRMRDLYDAVVGLR